MVPSTKVAPEDEAHAAFLRELERLIGLIDGPPECLLKFYGAMDVPDAEGVPTDLDGRLAVVDAALAAWAFNNFPAESLDALYRLQGRDGYIRMIGDQWIATDPDAIHLEGGVVALLFAGKFTDLSYDAGALTEEDA